MLVRDIEGENISGATNRKGDRLDFLRKKISLRASLTRGNGDRRVERGAGKTARIPRFEEQRRSFFQIPMETKGAVAPLSRRFSSRYLVVEARQWSSNF